MRAKASRIGHVGLAVRDIEASVRFYTEVVGLQLTEEFRYPEGDVGHGSTVSAGAFVRSGSAHHCISIFELKGDPEDHAGEAAYGLHHLAFEMDSAEDLISMYRRFKREGLPIVNARRGGPGNQPRFYGRDPDGNLIEFYWGIDQIGWNGIPRAYSEIEEIDLEKFDFDAFVAERERAAAAARGPTANSGPTA
jgi:catechol 2,3-dioxygenase